MSEQQDVQFSGSTNTMIAISLVASALSLALSVWSFRRVEALEAFVVVQAVHSAHQHQAGDAH